MAVREGFEPSVRFRTHTFQACSFDHSDTSPERVNMRVRWMPHVLRAATLRDFTVDGNCEFLVGNQCRVVRVMECFLRANWHLVYMAERSVRSWHDVFPGDAASSSTIAVADIRGIWGANSSCRPRSAGSACGVGAEQS